jgi:hypothetical protein
LQELTLKIIDSTVSSKSGFIGQMYFVHIKGIDNAMETEAIE